MGFEYRKQIEQQLGFALPPQQDESGEDVPMDPRIEAQLAPMLAQAAQQLLQQNQAQASQEQAQQAQQDPIIQMQQQELQLKAAEQQRKVQKDQTDAEFKAEQLKLEQLRLLSQHDNNKSNQKNDVLKTAAQIQANKQQDMLGKGVEVLKQLSQQNFQGKQQTIKPTKGEK